MPQYRRDALSNRNVDQAEHAGLWFDKYLSEGEEQNSVDENKEKKRELVEACAKIKEPESYSLFFDRWKATLTQAGAKLEEASVQGRLSVGLGTESVIETSITLHRTYGMPYIPGSALKGLAASFARQQLSGWAKESEAYKITFGTTDSAGFITFYDALYVPNSGVEGQALYPDVITVHHPDYYQEGKAAPADWDSPNPISFLSATGAYLIALAGPDAWVAAAFEILALALQEVGVGAKTSSGYGRLHLLSVNTNDPKSSETTAQADQLDVATYKQKLAAMPADRIPGEISALVQSWAALEIDEVYKREIAQEILAKIEQASKKSKKRMKKKDWYKKLLAGS